MKKNLRPFFGLIKIIFVMQKKTYKKKTFVRYLLN